MTALLYMKEGQVHLPFVRRRSDLSDHPGQVALPGGRLRPGETAWEAALRETVEELGVDAGRLAAVGSGRVVYTPISNYSVLPVVATLDIEDPGFQHDSGELEGVLEIPLAELLQDASWRFSDEPFRFRYFEWEGSAVWGLTERILSDLLPRLSGLVS